MAPGWERRRAELEEALTPVRTWLISQLAPQPGDTVLELGAGPGDTGLRSGRARRRGRAPHLERLLAGDGGGRPPPGRRSGARKRRPPRDRRRADRPRCGLGRWSASARARYMLVADPAGRSRRRRAACCDPADAWRCLSGAPPERNPWASDRRADPGRARSPPSHRNPVRRGSSAWRARSARGRCSSDAGFTDVRTDEVPMRFAFSDRRRLRAVGDRTSAARSRWFSEACPNRASARHSGPSSAPRSSPMPTQQRLRARRRRADGARELSYVAAAALRGGHRPPQRLRRGGLYQPAGLGSIPRRNAASKSGARNRRPEITSAAA